MRLHMPLNLAPLRKAGGAGLAPGAVVPATAEPRVPLFRILDVRACRVRKQLFWRLECLSADALAPFVAPEALVVLALGGRGYRHAPGGRVGMLHIRHVHAGRHWRQG